MYFTTVLHIKILKCELYYKILQKLYYIIKYYNPVKFKI